MSPRKAQEVRLAPGEKLTPRKWAASLEALEARAETLAARFEGDTPALRLARKAEAIVSPRAFCRTYLPHYFRDEGCALHDLLHLLYAFATYGAVRAPRGHAKTTVGTFGYALHQVVCGAVLRSLETGELAQEHPDLARAIEDARASETRRLLARPWTCAELGIPEHWDPEVTAEMDRWLAEVHARIASSGIPLPNWDPYIQILAVTVELATEFTSAIRSELEENELIRYDWGDLSPCYTGDWRRTLKYRRPASADDWESNGVRCKAFGMNGAVRGGRHGPWRPTLALCDDLDSEESTRTDTQRDASWKKVIRTLDKGLDPHKKRTFVVGTPVHGDCVVVRLTERPEAKARWTSLRFRAMDESGRILYPAQWDREKLEEERYLDEEGYGSELDDQPPAEGGCPFAELQFYDRATYADLDLPRVMAFDPSLGKNKKSDFQALVQVRGPTPEGDVLVDRVDLWRIPSPKALMAEVRLRIREDRPTLKVIELIGFQALLLYVEGMEEDLEGWITLESQAEAKDIRIRSLAPAINAPKPGQPPRRRILFPSDGSCAALERQARSYPRGKRDGLDALEMADRQIRASDDWGWS